MNERGEKNLHAATATKVLNGEQQIYTCHAEQQKNELQELQWR